jgi:hypothetical protein
MFLAACNFVGQPVDGTWMCGTPVLKTGLGNLKFGVSFFWWVPLTIFSFESVFFSSCLKKVQQFKETEISHCFRRRCGVTFKKFHSHSTRLACMKHLVIKYWRRENNLTCNFTTVWPCIVTDCLRIRPTDALNSNFIGITTLHVSGSLSAHHQEFLTVHRLWYILCSSILLLVAKGHHNCIKCAKADVRLRTPVDGQKGCPKRVES